MGSLMAGWSTSPPSAKTALKRRTSSLTRDEVKRYWQAKASENREHLMEAHKAAFLAKIRTNKDSELLEESEDYFPGDTFSEGGSQSGSQSGSQPATPTANESRDDTFKDGWWRRSNYAFLNEPPTNETKQSSYVSQFHVVDVRAKAAEMDHGNAKHAFHTRSSLSIF
ncbi:hypothetical protein R1flu_013801 [Riccia fluitans]|uniref:Uncharacterized protein n=1 Tax=Riccia fluitans TaxID=41844 RepID=A0ABD1YEM3_9MARC